MELGVGLACSFVPCYALYSAPCYAMYSAKSWFCGIYTTYICYRILLSCRLG